MIYWAIIGLVIFIFVFGLIKILISDKTMNTIYALLWSLFFLSILIIFVAHNPSVLIYLFGETIDKEWCCNLLLNVGAGLLTSVLLIFFYDLVLRRKDKEDKDLRNQLALDSLYDLLKAHFEIVLFGMYRAAAKEEKTFDTLKTFFSEDYYTTLYYLDFYKSPFSDGTPKYCNIIPDANTNFGKYLRDEVIQFGIYLDPQILKLSRNIRFSKFIKECIYLESMCSPITIKRSPDISEASVRSIYKKVFNLSPNGFTEKFHERFYTGLKEHIEIFCELVELHDKYTKNMKLCEAFKNPNTGDVTTGCCRQDDAE